MEESKLYLNTDGEYGKYIIQDLNFPQNMFPADFGEMYNRFAKRVLWMDSNNVPGAFQMNVAWWCKIPETNPLFEEHSHDTDELIGFFGCDPEDPYNLNAELEVSINGERHLLTRSSIIFAPAGMPHMRIYFHKVDKPFLHVSVVKTNTYDGGSFKGANK